MQRTTTTLVAFVAAAAAMLAQPAAGRGGVSIRDVAHLQGARKNSLMAVSMVVGLKGTGDGKSLHTMRSLAQLFSRLGHNVGELRDIDVSNVALVHVTATVGEHGARDGDALDVKVASINGAKSLAGGRLVQCAMLGPMAQHPIVYALADGDVTIEDANSPTTGVIKGGATIERDIIPSFLRDGRITLVLDASHANWGVATAVAKVVNDAEADPGKTLATATGPGAIVVTVPTPELPAPADFIARVLSLPVLMPDLKAKIVINRRTGTIVITGEVEIDPVVFSQRGLTVTTVTPPVPATPATPKLTTEQFHLLAPRKGRTATKAQELVDAFNKLQVPIDDQIAVIHTLKRTGRLHAEVIEE